MKKQVEAWKGTRVPDETPKLVVYQPFLTIASRVKAIRNVWSAALPHAKCEDVNNVFLIVAMVSRSEWPRSA
jgi:hypothetical protein